MHIRIYLLQWSKDVFKLLHVHTGFNDYSLLWHVRGTGWMDILFCRRK